MAQHFPVRLSIGVDRALCSVYELQAIGWVGVVLCAVKLDGFLAYFAEIAAAKRAVSKLAREFLDRQRQSLVV